MQPGASLSTLQQLFGRDFCVSRIESVAGAMLEASPAEAAQVAQLFLGAQPAEVPAVLATLFSARDVETAHQVIADVNVEWCPTLQRHVRALLMDDLTNQRLLPCREQRQPSEQSLRLFDRYVELGPQVFRRDPVVLPEPALDSQVKFMLIQVGSEHFFRVGNPSEYHERIVSSMIRELFDCGAPKSATGVVPRGGGFLWVEETLDGRPRAILFGVSQQYGKADMGLASELLAAGLPGTQIDIRHERG